MKKTNPQFEINLINFQKVEYESTSHSFNKAVVASYNNVSRYGFHDRDNYIFIPQAKRNIMLVVKEGIEYRGGSDKKLLVLSETQFEKAKPVKEVVYNLSQMFDDPSSEVRRGVRFSKRREVRVFDYKEDKRLDQIYEGWKTMKEANPKLFRMAFNPARYRRSYELKKFGYNVVQKIIYINDEPYALINFSIDGDRAYELSFLSLFAERNLRLVNDQNDCIIVNAIHDLYTNHAIKTVNLGTSAGIKGLAMFKHKHLYTEQTVWSRS